ncbi:hypothetical protein M8J76_015316 [Diaphorina citri]|nr:hypothetical protein M8J76_015316 [Diaphorina citri]
MFVDDLIGQFYNKLSGKRVLVIVHHDLDAICSMKILQSLFKCDSRVYALEPVAGVQDFKLAYERYRHEIKNVLLINCGGTHDIVEILEPEEDCIFYILDSHKPTDFANIFNSSQVRILCRMDDVELENIPEYNQIFESEEEDEESEGEIEDEATRSVDFPKESWNEEKMKKRRERILWEENRKKILFQYLQFSYYGRSSAMIMYELAWKMNKENLELLWYAIIGVMEQYILNKIPTSLYKSDVEFIKNQSGRLNPLQLDDMLEAGSLHSSVISGNHHIPGLRIECEDDAQLALYKHWTLQASLRHTMYTAVSLKLWTMKGEQRLQRLLAEMGMPLLQSKQLYNSMDLSIRRELPTMLSKMAADHQLDELIMPSFTLLHGYRTKIQASDYVYAMLALLESPHQEKKPSDCFLDAAYCLARQNKDMLSDGIQNAKKFLSALFKTVQSLLDMKQVNSSGPFLYGTLDCKYYSKPHALSLLATFILKAFVASSAGSRTRNHSKPLIASAPLDPLAETCIMIGIPPVTEIIPRSFFGRAFEQASERTNARVSFDYFDSSIISIHKSDRHKFVSALQSLLS